MQEFYTLFLNNELLYPLMNRKNLISVLDVVNLILFWRWLFLACVECSHFAI